MTPLQIVLSDGAKQSKPNEQAQKSAEPKRNLFGDNDSSDSDTEKPKVRHISSLSAARPQSPPQKPSPPPLPEPEKSGPQGSQIARLVARRKEAAVGLAKESGETRDEALFKYDVERCDDEASVAGYEKRPVDGFGELMLRSMGWRGTVDKGDEKEPTARPARLGLGAKFEDLPPAMRRKRPRGNDVGVQRESAIDSSHPPRADLGRDTEEGQGGESETQTRAGVTADNLEQTEGKLGGREGFAGNSRKAVANGSPARRRRRLSRFADDPRT